MAAAQPLERPHSRLTFRLLLREALAIYRRRFWTVAAVAVAVLVPVSAVETVAEHYGEVYRANHEGTFVLVALGISFAASLATSFGVVLFAGIIEAVVGADRFGREERPLGRVLRELPYVGLVLADMLVLALSFVGYALFVVPGLVVTTLFGIVGPIIINIERAGVVRSMRRSFDLIQPRFWLAFFAITVPVLVESSLHHSLALAYWNEGFLVGLLVNAVLAVVVGASVGLLEVTLAHELIAREGSLPA